MLHTLSYILVQDCISKHIKRLILRLYLCFCLSVLSPSFHLWSSPFHRNSLPLCQCKGEPADFQKKTWGILRPQLMHFDMLLLFILHWLPGLPKLSWIADQFQAGCYDWHTDSLWKCVKFTAQFMISYWSWSHLCGSDSHKYFGGNPFHSVGCTV